MTVLQDMVLNRRHSEIDPLFPYKCYLPVGHYAALRAALRLPGWRFSFNTSLIRPGLTL